MDNLEEFEGFLGSVFHVKDRSIPYLIKWVKQFIGGYGESDFLKNIILVKLTSGQ